MLVDKVELDLSLKIAWNQTKTESKPQEKGDTKLGSKSQFRN